jgi:hypothetical protein
LVVGATTVVNAESSRVFNGVKKPLVTSNYRVRVVESDVDKKESYILFYDVMSSTVYELLNKTSRSYTSDSDRNNGKNVETTWY